LKILLVTDNLMEKARLASRWRREGAEVRFLEEDSPPDLVAVDLEASDAPARIIGLREAYPQARCLAFGSHVDKAAFEAAKEAGAQDAVARGAVAERVVGIILRDTGSGTT
jgi:DNA-binding NarL/FixJ family response regulator